MRHMMKLCSVPALIAITHSSIAAAVPTPVAPMEEGGVLAAISLSLAAGIWLARRKQ
jgi:hypothetical protein